jgi:hypothetical protein
MKRNTECLNERLKEIMTELNIDLHVEENNIHDKSMRSAGIKQKWINIKFEEERVLKKLETQKKKLLSKIKEQIDNGTEPKHIIELKANKEIEINPINNKIEVAIKNQKEIIRFIDLSLKNILGFGYDIKNCLDLLKMENV